MRPYKRSGFTLIELMVVIAILAFLAAIGVPAYNSYMTKAAMTEGKNNIATLKLAEEEYYLENNSYFYGADTAAVEAASGGLWKAVGTDGTVHFAYNVSGAGNVYTITATGTIGRAAGEPPLTESN